MCFFHYSQCDNCRFPSTTQTDCVQECDTFFQQLHQQFGNNPPSRADLAKQAQGEPKDERSAVTEWQLCGLHTVAQYVVKMRGTSEQEAFWDVRPPRNCIRWTPQPTRWICDVCQKFASEPVAAKEDSNDS